MIKSFPYYGGKQPHLDFLFAHFPKSESIKHFVDVFGGSAVVLLNANYRVKTYNDRNEELVNVFKTIREKPEELSDQLRFTLFSRSEFYKSFEPVEASFKGDVNIERARRFLIKIVQRLGSLPDNNKSWAVVRRCPTGKTDIWRHMPNRVFDVADEFRNIQIENIDGLKLIEKTDNEKTLLYLDPPYPHETRRLCYSAYSNYEMNEQHHNELIEVLKNVKNAKVALSSYRNDLYDSLNWNIVEYETKTGISQDTRMEALYMNYELPNRLF